jgi:hypothetical protein
MTAALTLTSPSATAAGERQELEQLRNTVVNLLQSLVDQGVLTQERARTIVREAQSKAESDAAPQAVDEGAVRVPYVPQIVKDEIATQVAESVRPGVVEDVVGVARAEGWGVPGALPDWLSRITIAADVRVRTEQQFFASGNAENFYLDFNTINARGGVVRAGPAALLNVSEDRFRLRAQARLAVQSEIAPGWTAGLRLATGNLQDPASLNQTLGNTGARYTIGVDQLYVRYESDLAGLPASLTAIGGRYASPWFSPTELLYDRDLMFEGVAVTGRYTFGEGSEDTAARVFGTLSAAPLQEVALSSNDKWLYGAQLGVAVPFLEDHRITVAGAFFDFRNVAGQRNAPESTLLDYTAPQALRIGNSLFDIRNSADLTSNLFALAADFRIVNLAVGYDLRLGGYRLRVAADAVRNIGFDRDEIRTRTGLDIEQRNEGYQFEVAFGRPDVAVPGAWRATLGYRYVQRDAVLDAFTFSDFRGGGTDAEGYYLSGELGLAGRTWMRLRYLSGSELDGLLFPLGTVGQRFPYGMDTLQLDLNAQF